MTLGNMRELGVGRLIASCLNDACRHTALIEVWSYPAETELPYFSSRVVCAKCGSRGNKIDVRPNWKEQPSRPSLTVKIWRWSDRKGQGDWIFVARPRHDALHAPALPLTIWTCAMMALTAAALASQNGKAQQQFKTSKTE
jgi:hypothetical protein